MLQDKLCNERLSPHFTYGELTRTSQTAYKFVNPMFAKRYINNLILLANYLLEPARAILKTPLIITSGYRCYALNKEIGGSKNSQHLNATAADFIIKDNNLPLENIFIKLKDSPFLNYGQLILERSWIHLSLGAPFRSLSKCRDSFKIL